MKAYKNWAPSGFDTRGLALDDRQEWLVAPVSVNRDSGCLERSNWEIVTAELTGWPDDCEIHRFGHWACGWFEIALVRPGSPAASAAELWESALSEYPVASDAHFSDLETLEALKWWDDMGLRSRVELCKRAGVSIFAARRGSPPENDRLWELLTAS